MNTHKIRVLRSCLTQPCEAKVFTHGPHALALSPHIVMRYIEELTVGSYLREISGQYITTAKGRGELERKRVATPRTVFGEGTYTGEKPIAIRPGALDFLKCHSRRGDELVPHALPISMAGGCFSDSAEGQT